jgi:hypothetical protein
MQQQIDSAASTIQFMTGQQQMLSGALSEQRSVIERVAEVLGKHFAGLPPKIIQVQQIRSQFQLPAPVALDITQLYSQAQLTEFVDMSCHMLDVYRTELKTDQLSGNTHVYLRSDRGDLAYSISQSGLRNIDKRDLAQHIAKTFAEEIKAKL